MLLTGSKDYVEYDIVCITSIISFNWKKII